MVEFGLKLQDNKVAEWGDYYMEYERLKQILKKCASASQRCKELSTKMRATARTKNSDPHVAAGNVDCGGGRGSTPPQSGSMTPSIHEEDLPSTPPPNTTTPTRGVEILETSKLLSSPPLEMTVKDGNNYGTAMKNTTTWMRRTESTKSLDSSKGDSVISGSVLSRALEKATSGVTDYFQRGQERQCRDAERDLDKLTEEFDQQLTADIDRVNAFYEGKMAEIRERLDFLKESVAQSRRKSVSQQGGDDGGESSSMMDTNNNTPTPSHLDSVATDEEASDHSHHYHHQNHDVVDDDLETPIVSSRKHPGDDHHSRNPQQQQQQHANPFVFAKAIARMSRLSVRFSSAGSNSIKRAQARAQERLESQLPILSTEDEDELVDNLNTVRADKDLEAKMKEADSIKRALVDQYRTAKLLHNFAIMNYTGFVKIVKKHDKTLPDRKGKHKQAIKPLNICNEGKDVEVLADRMEILFANWFCDRNVSEARAQMFPKRGDGLEMDWTQLRLGYRLGMCTILALWVCWDCVWGLLDSGASTIGARTAFPVFRGCGGLLLLEWCWSCSVWVWNRYRINYIYLFDFNPHLVSTPLTMFNDAVDHTLVFMIVMLLYYKAGVHEFPFAFPAGVLPLFLVIYTTYYLIFPLRIRMPMWEAIWQVVTAPLYSPSFFLGYVGDVFTSMVKVFQDLAWTFCFVFSGDWRISEDLDSSELHLWSRSMWYNKVLIPLLTLAPLWFRFNQCLRRYADTGDRFPHLANAFKYALSQTVTLFGAFHPLYLETNKESNWFQFFWTFAFVASSLYSFAWDVYMDWGLGRLKHNFLGLRLMYPKLEGYYVIIGIDFVLRFAWVLTLVPPESGAKFALPQYLSAVSMMLELFRRTAWGFLRLENEHRSNTSGFRRVAFVPLHFSTGHQHEYQEDKARRGVSVLIEVAVVTVVVLAAATVSVIAAQKATERMSSEL